MANERSTTQSATSGPTSKPSTNQRLDYATSRAEVLFGCYRRGDANDPDRYVAAISAVLTLYDFELMREATDPRTGIQTTEKFAAFMPNAGELKIYCDGIAARQHRLQELGKLPRVDFSRDRLAPPAPAAGDQATIFVPASNAVYPKLLDWSKTADPRLFKFDTRPGIWVSYGIWENRRTVVRERLEDKPTSLQLSETARKVMADLDAERTRNLPADQHEVAAE